MYWKSYVLPLIIPYFFLQIAEAETTKDWCESIVCEIRYLNDDMVGVVDRARDIGHICWKKRLTSHARQRDLLISDIISMISSSKEDDHAGT